MSRILSLLLLIAVTACASAPTPVSAPTATNRPPTAPAASAETPVAEAAVASSPVWMSLPLTNARTGQSFTLADYAGKTIYVEPMATWCTNCRRQLNVLTGVAAAADPQAYVFVSLSVAESVTDEQLAAYADQQGWPWIFAVATPEMLTALTESFGRVITAPPSTPHFLVRPDNSVTEIFTGQHSAEQLSAQLTESARA